MSITRDQIYTAANTLNDQGVKPTLVAVRRILGAGSFTTIHDALKEWKMLKAAVKTVDQLQESPPAALKDQLNTFGLSLWFEALTLATNRFAQEKEMITETNREKEIFYSELNKLAEEYDQSLEAAKCRIEQLREEITQLSEKSKLASQQVSDITHEKAILSDRILILQSELERSNQKYDASQQGFANLSKQLTSLQQLLIEKNKQSEKS